MEPAVGHRPGINFCQRERVKLQLRLEAYNAVNHANFGYNTGSAYINGGGGNIVGSYNGNRNIQLGAKVVF